MFVIRIEYGLNVIAFMSCIEQVALENRRCNPYSIDQDSLLMQESTMQLLDSSVLTILVAGQVIVTDM